MNSRLVFALKGIHLKPDLVTFALAKEAAIIKGILHSFFCQADNLSSFHHTEFHFNLINECLLTLLVLLRS